jgi:hypothetical protein
VSEHNKAAARAAFEVWSRGTLEDLDRFVSPTVVHHDPYDPHGAEGLAGMKKTIVATRWTSTMTHDGKRVTLKGITIDRFERGMIVEAWRNMDMLAFLRQIEK